MINVLIVDDSAVIRKVLQEIFASDPDIHVVGTAADPFIARDKIKTLNPDVITLDVEMPRMDGITFLRNLMRLRPMPVVMISTLTQQGAPTTLEALEIGAVDYVGKPTQNPERIADYADLIIEKVKTAAKANIQRLEKQASRAPLVVERTAKLGKATDYIIAIGASTGGTEAIREVLMSMPVDSPPIVITQHIPPVFSTSFALRMDRSCDLTVHEAANGDKLMTGHVYIAPGDRQMQIERRGGHYYCRVWEGERVNRHMPSVEVLFQSVAKECKGKAVGVMLTGMGADGARAMLEMKHAGCYNFAQDQETAVVWGMPGAAVEVGAVDKVVPLNKVAHAVMHFIAQHT
ncbi:MAG: chemotaxis response regulator protein-glutamate methylesterase [Oceanospirillaceae bacterium]|nr:chemotaxis response regulator protein-glutamate methylesterase [Oceanospirillaceae bacterium]MCP5350077.1 chemotaxis response regulator protein-glutamate methylesterase [Oceanospirillaceae bacterium]